MANIIISGRYRGSIARAHAHTHIQTLFCAREKGALLSFAEELFLIKDKELANIRSSSREWLIASNASNSRHLLKWEVSPLLPINSERAKIDCIHVTRLCF
jgi:hypothetical protein